MSERRRTAAALAAGVIVSATTFTLGGMVGDAIRSAPTHGVYQPDRLDTEWAVAKRAARTCEPVVPGSISATYWGQLIEAGWEAEPGDGLEAIYAPNCQGLDG